MLTADFEKYIKFENSKKRLFVPMVNATHGQSDKKIHF